MKAYKYPDPIVMATLPDMCFALNPTSKEPIAIKKGERGYYTAKDMKAADVAAFNAKMGVTPAQREAMLAGSLFGWNVPGANPAVYAGLILE